MGHKNTLQSKIMIALIVFAMAISMVSADVSLNPFADKKIVEPIITEDMSNFIKADFNSEYGVIRLSNTFLWITTDKIAEYSLTRNTKYCLMNCEAEGKVTLYSDGILFDDVQFKTLTGQETAIKSSEYQIFQGYQDNYVDVPDTYNDVCVDYPANATSSAGKYCHKEVATYKKENNPIEIWNAYKGEELKAGDYRWKIKGVKNAGDSVDFIPLRYDKDFSEWAVWTSGLSVGLQHYMNMSETSGSAVVVNQIDITANGSIDGNANRTVDGKIGRGISNFKASENDFLNTPILLPSGNADYTFAMWVKLYSAKSGALAHGGTGGGPTTFGHFYISLTGTQNLWYVNDGTTAILSSALTPNTWYYIVYAHNSTATQSYLNGVKDGSVNYVGALNPVTLHLGATGGRGADGTDTVIDELGIWNRTLSATEVTDLYNSGAGISWEPPPVTSLSIANSIPSNNKNISTSSITFGCNATTNVQTISRITLSASGGARFNQTIGSLSGNGYNATFVNSTLPDGSYTWNCTGYGSLGLNATSTSWTFIKDTTAPTFTLVSLPNVSTTVIPINATINVTTTDVNLLNCSYATSDAPANITYTCNTAINIPFSTGGIKTIRIYANDTFGNWNSTSYTVYIYDFIVSTSGNPVALEGSSQTFSLLINSTSFAIGDANASLWYNGAYKGYNGKLVNNPNSILFTNILSIPIGTGNSTGKNITWFWTYNTTLISEMNTSKVGQNVISLNLSDCDINSGRVILNVSLKDEELNTLLAQNVTTIEVDMDVSDLTNTSKIWNFHKTWLANNSASVCITPELLNNSNYRIDLTIGYEAQNHVKEFYYLDNGTLDNTNNFNSYTDNSIDLMDLATVDSTTFLFSFTDTNGLKVDNALVHTFRKYIGEGLFREVERSKQDNNGETHVHLVEEDVIYYFMVSQYGKIIYTSETYNAKCLSTPCSILLSASSTATNWSIIDNQGGKYTVTSDKNTRIATTTFSLNSISTVNVSLYRLENGVYVLINQSTLTASGGSIDLSVPLAYGNATFFEVIYSDGQKVKSVWIDLTDRGQDYFGSLGALLGGIIVLALLLMAVSEGVGAIVFTILALGVIGIMKLVDLNPMALISIICAGAIIIFKLINRRNKNG